MCSSDLGDDVVCVTKGNFNVLSVDAGAGNDFVDGTAMAVEEYLTVLLGDGSDTFVGGAGSDRVRAGGGAGTSVVDTEPDLVDTGDGPDTVTSGAWGASNLDEVRTGDGEDLVTWAGTMGAAGVLDAGAGTDTLEARAAGQTFGVDLAAQTLTRDGAREASFSSFERLTVLAGPGVGLVEILGTNGSDVVSMDATMIVRADLGGGDDDLTLAGMMPASRIDLGSGRDSVNVMAPVGSVELDLNNRTLGVDGARAGSLEHVEDAYVSARQATVIGDDRANDLTVNGCRVTVNGRSGKDDIGHRSSVDRGPACDGGRATLRGGSGNDTITGGFRADRIYGGGGNDTINGSKGRDVAIGGPDRDKCKAEVERSCER